MQICSIQIHTDDAYDGEPVSQAVLGKQPDAKVIVPPHKIVVLSATSNSQQGNHIRDIERHGCIAWQQKRRTVYAIMLNLRCNATSAFSAIP